MLNELYPCLMSYTFHLDQTKLVRGLSIIGFKNAKSLKDHLVRAVLYQLDIKGRSKPCEGANRSREVCDSVKDTTKFKKQSQKKLLTFLKGSLDYNSNNMIYLLECKKCQFKCPYVGGTVTKFRYRFNIYNSTHRKFRKKLKKRIIQEIKTKTVS